MHRLHLCAAASILTALVVSAPASADREFDERSIRGTWALSVEGYVAEGLINQLFEQGTPLFAIARVIFDGEGGCRSDDQLVIGDTAIPADPRERRIAIACTYEVQPDGYGFFDVTFENEGGGGSTVTTARFIIEDRERMSFIADNDELGIFGGGTLVRQTRRIR